MIKKWDYLPCNMQNDAVRPYYEILRRKPLDLAVKRIFDIVFSLILLILLSPLFIFIAICIKIGSPGSIFFKQERVTQYGRNFLIYKFRTMIENAEKVGTQVTVKNDSRITKSGRWLRKYRLDELPQLINIFIGDMSFVGTRPEVTKYVEKYTDEMLATLLLPAGVTSEASIKYKDESRLLDTADDIDKTYIEEVLPQKMKYNLESIKNFNMWKEMSTMLRTVKAVTED